MKQTVVFTFLAQDRLDHCHFRAAAFVSPRLTPDGPGTPAGAFPAFADWPQLVREARILVELDGGGAFEVERDGEPLRSDLWQEYLAPLEVRGWSIPDLSRTELRTFAAQPILALTEGLYHAVALASRGGHPDPLARGLGELGDAYQEIRGDGRSRGAIDRQVDRLLAARDERRAPHELGTAPGEAGGLAPRVARLAPAEALEDATGAALNLAEARRFYDRPEARDPDAALYPRPAEDQEAFERERRQTTTDDPDFHGALAALGDHPELLRALGIVVGFRLPDHAVGAGGDLSVRLEHELLSTNPIKHQPRTRTVADGESFEPVSETGDLLDGALGLEDPDRFDVAQADIDSAALLVEQRIANVSAIAGAASVGEPITGDLPALRSTGLTITRQRRSLILGQRIARSASNAVALENGDGPVLFAEDLVRGLRADVHDGHAWRSLMRRHVRFLDRATHEERYAFEGEAFLKASALSSQPGAAVDRAYLHEALLGWDGWSLAVPRPGRHIPVAHDDPGALADGGDDFNGQLALHIEVGIVPGTLPRLRYGAGYRLRVRTVDLSGRSTPKSGDRHATPEHVFRRFQPVGHPVTIPRFAFTEGESTLRLVIRSGVDADAADMSVTPVVVDAATYADTLNDLTPRTFARFRAGAERHLAPAKTSQAEAELHGRFDDAIGHPPGPAAIAAARVAFARAQREQGTLADTVVLSADDPDASTPADGIHLVPPLTREEEFTQAALDATLAALPRGEAPAPGFVIVHDTDALAVPYLPDPAAAGVALRFTGRGTAKGWEHRRLLPWTGTWPDIDAYRLVLVSGEAPSVTVAGHVVTVALPPGGQADIRVSASIEQETLDLLGIWDWIGDTVDLVDVPGVLAGGHQMLTPGERLTLVHATRRPLQRPQLGPDFSPLRNLGDTRAQFAGALVAQAATTSRIDVEATWSEWFDEPASGRPPAMVSERQGHAFDLTLAEDDDVIALGPGAGSAMHELGDHVHRLVTYTPTATTRFREYLPPPVAGDLAGLQVTGPARTVHVPSSARPPAPVVHAVMPTFRWDDLPEDPYDPMARARTRRGGLRVWLERPWYRSGDGELLGVVLSGADGIFPTGDLRRQYVSLWGKDPIRAGGELTAPMPRPRDFAGDGLVERDRLMLAETGSHHPGVTVIGHPVTYSPERDLWFADLEVDPGEAIWPFLRLGLVRLQPWSVPGAEISPVVVADFVQLTNRRTATITRPDDHTVRVTVSGITERLTAPVLLPAGKHPAPDHGPPSRGVRAWIEQRGALASDLDWHQISAPVDLRRIDEDDVARVWSRDLELDTALPTRRPGSDPDGDGHDLRLVLTEWEALPHDDPYSPEERIERIVYLDRFGL